MTRAAVCGASFSAAVSVLGIEAVEDRPDLVLVDLMDPAAVASAARVPRDVPRVAVGTAEHEALLRAAGCDAVVARSADPAVIGPLVASALPPRPRRRTRLVLITGVAGGSGRTLLTVNLAARLAERSSVVVIDATGTGAAAWWLRLAPGSWSDLEGLVDELTAEHLAVVAAERDRLRLVGGASPAPTTRLLAATARATDGLGDLVLVDAPSLFDDRTRALALLADRIVVVAGDDPASLAALAAAPVDGDRTWLIASRSGRGSLTGRDVFRALPDDARSVRAAASGPTSVGGALGRVYDELAELLAIDIA